MPIKPPRLNFGDRIGIVTPASPPPDPNAIDHSIAVLESFGFKVELAASARKRLGFLAGNDRERARDLMRMFSTPKIRALFCLRGGYGTARILPLLDYALIRANPKILLGYSDITSLHCALLKQAGLVSFHGPMLNSDLIKKNLPPFTLQCLLRMLMEAAPPGSICDDTTNKSISVLRTGKVSGELLGGNLSVLNTTLGTAYQPSFKGKILFLEDLNEPPYRCDRLLTHLLNSGALTQVAGIAIGSISNCATPKASPAHEYTQTLQDVLQDRLLPLRIPVVTGLPFGHARLNATLPLGVRAILDARKGDLIITEPAVS